MNELDELLKSQTALSEQVSKLEHGLRVAKSDLSDIQDKIAVIKCPFSVGDKVTNGKTTWIVTRVLGQNYKPYYDIKIAKIKKDGTPFAQDSYLYSWDVEKLKLAEDK